MRNENDWELLLGPYESGHFIRKDIEEKERNKIIKALYNLLLNLKTDYSKLKDEVYKERLIYARQQFLSKYKSLINGRIT